MSSATVVREQLMMLSGLEPRLQRTADAALSRSQHFVRITFGCDLVVTSTAGRGYGTNGLERAAVVGHPVKRWRVWPATKVAMQALKDRPRQRAISWLDGTASHRYFCTLTRTIDGWAISIFELEAGVSFLGDFTRGKE